MLFTCIDIFLILKIEYLNVLLKLNITLQRIAASKEI